MDTIAGEFGNWNRSLKAAGLTPGSTRRSWDDETIIAALREWDEKRDKSKPATRTAYKTWRGKQRNPAKYPPYRSVELSDGPTTPKEAWAYACKEADIDASHRSYAEVA